MNTPTANAILAVDPGDRKCGMAVARVDDKGEISCLHRKIVPRIELIQSVERVLGDFDIKRVIVGNGTSSRSALVELRERFGSVSFLVVDEKDTTLQARELYWITKGRRGWRRLLPSTLQVPPEPIDDFAALVLAHRVLGDL